MQLTRLYGRAVRRFATTPEKLEEIIEFFYKTATDDTAKISTRMEAAKNYIVAESLNQKDEHKLLGLMRSNDSATESGGNRFLAKPGEYGVDASTPGLSSD